MSAKDKSAKDKAMAAYLKKMGVKRTTQRCPMACGNAHVGNILEHLNVCKGKRH